MLVDTHLERVKHRPTPNAKIKTYLDRFLSLVGEDRAVDSLRVADIQKYITDRRKAKKSNQTINREMNEIRSCLNSAWKYFPTLETFRCPRYEKLQEPEDGRRQTWSDEEIEAVIRELRRPATRNEARWQVEHRYAIADLFIVCQETGMRAGEARKLHRSQIKRNVLIITSYKGKHPRVREVVMNDTVAEIVTRRAKACAWIFPGPKKDQPMQSYYKAFTAACKRAGVEYGAKSGLIFNDARRTFVNNALDAGKPIRALIDTTGHSVQTMARHYARSTQEQKNEIVSTGRNYGRFLDAESPKNHRKGRNRKNEEPAEVEETKAFTAESGN